MLFSREIYLGHREVEAQKNVYGGRNSALGYLHPSLLPSYRDQVLDPFLNNIPKGDGSLVLDVGAGRGAESNYMEAKGVGKSIRLDISPYGLKGQAGAVVGTSWLLPFQNEVFSGVHMKDVITHVRPEYRPKLFSEIFRVLKSGGVSLIAGVTQYFPARYQYPTFSGDLEEQAKEKGLNILRIGKWSPNRLRDGDRDWYPVSNVERFVIELGKNKQPSVIMPP